MAVITIPKSNSSDERSHITLHAIECTECREATPIAESEEVVYNWQSEHYNTEGHANYWHYKIERGRARIVDPSKGHW